MKLKLKTKLILLIDIIIIACFIFVYAINSIKVFWITTSMETATHRYLAYIFYSEKEVKKVMDSNYITELKDTTNVEDVKVGQIKKQDTYESIYEKQILDHGEDELYKLIEFKYNEFNCYMIGKALCLGPHIWAFFVPPKYTRAPWRVYADLCAESCSFFPAL